MPIRLFLDLLPANLNLTEAEMAFINAIDRNNRLRKAPAPIIPMYDIIMIDSPSESRLMQWLPPQSIWALQVHPYFYKAIDQLLDRRQVIRCYRR